MLRSVLDALPLLDWHEQSPYNEPEVVHQRQHRMEYQACTHLQLLNRLLESRVRQCLLGCTNLPQRVSTRAMFLNTWLIACETQQCLCLPSKPCKKCKWGWRVAYHVAMHS